MKNAAKKEYMSFKNIFGVRKQNRPRFGLESFAGNYSHDKHLAKTSWLCLCQKSREEEVHLLSGQCQVYGDLIEKYSDLTEDDQLVQFFGDVLARRDALEISPLLVLILIQVMRMSRSRDHIFLDRPSFEIYISDTGVHTWTLKS